MADHTDVMRQAFEAYETFRERGDIDELHSAMCAMYGALVASPCPCGDRFASQCPGAWEPGCDLGNNEAHVRVAAEQATHDNLRDTVGQAIHDVLTGWYETEDGTIGVDPFDSRNIDEIADAVIAVLPAAPTAEQARPVAVPAGYALVPVEPTEAMLSAIDMTHSCAPIDQWRAAIAAAPPAPAAVEQAPIDMVLHCPACGEQHIDAPEWADGGYFDTMKNRQTWSNPPHRSHLCHGCGHIWRPADVPTNGVASIKTKGKADSPPAPARQEPLTESQVDDLIHSKHFDRSYKLHASDETCSRWYRLGLRDGERAHGIVAAPAEREKR